ncbi:MAG: (2Fe-2S) ferredoxin domain-containing protein [Alphaproteobacteria bacterium]|nr:(2Fe-2S) ferredoxin domain-containing protein [Alphaproteobacteria bacterium]
MEAEPFYRAHIFCCTNKRAPGHERGCCADKDSERLRNYMKRRVKEAGLEAVRVNGTGCLDRCELGPCIVIYPEGVWYAPKNEADVDEIIASHLQGGARVARLLLPPRAQTA